MKEVVCDIGEMCVVVGFDVDDCVFGGVGVGDVVKDCSDGVVDVLVDEFVLVVMLIFC